MKKLRVGVVGVGYLGNFHAEKYAKMEDVDLTKMTKFPFQAQIQYTALDGNRCIRVISQI